MQQDPEKQTENSPASGTSGRPPLPIIAFTSGKGGCGKTTIAVNFANIVAKSRNKVLLIDLDLSNRGASSLFSRWTRNPHKNFTLTRLLRDEVMVGNRPRMLIEVKPGFYLMPASSPDESVWTPPQGTTLSDFVEDLRSKIMELAERFDIACVVLDCFCGLDLLTTAGATVSDHTIIVNEPDIVTFSGAIFLLNHLEETFTDPELGKKPKLHFVINRLRGDQSVQQLSMIYRENLVEAVNEIVLCHFPYHDRIVETFGNYPFISDLIPRSLFVRKLELLTYLLFKGNMDHLIKRRVSRWSERRIRSIYKRSMDRSAVDSKYLIPKLINFPLLLGLWLIISFVLLETFPLSPMLAWIFLLLCVASGSSIIVFSILHGFGLAALLSFSLTAFRYRLGKRQQIAWTEIRHFLSNVISLTGGILMSVTVVTAGIATLIMVGMFLDWTFNLGLFTESTNHFGNRMLEVAIRAPIRTVDLRGARLKYADLSGFGNNPRKFIAGDTVFQSCQFGDSALQRIWENCTFSECSFVDPDNVRYTQYKGIKINRGIWRDVTFTRFVSPQLIIFENSDLKNVTIQVGQGAHIKFMDCVLDRTVLIPGADCFLAFREKVEIWHDGVEIKAQIGEVGAFPKGLEIRGTVDILTDEQFEARVTILWPELSLADKIKKERTSLESAGDAGKMRDRNYRMDLALLIEYYILSGRPMYLRESTELNKNLLVLATAGKDTNVTGLAYMLDLMICTVRGTPHEKALKAWRGWLETNGGWVGNYLVTGDEYDRLMEWFWRIWDEHFSILSLNSRQWNLLNAIKASANGVIHSNELKVVFEQVSEPSPTPQEE